MPDPFLEDSEVCHLAEKYELSVSRFESIEITDEKAIAGAGLMHQTPDYSRIRKALQNGVDVPGARVRGVEYMLRRRDPR